MSAERRKKVIAVTPVHNRCGDTLRCLRSIRNSNLDNIDLHLIVVDDGSTDGTAEKISEQFPEVEVLSGAGDLWYTGGMNLGLSRALELGCDYILGFNNDSIFDQQCIFSLVACAEQYPHSVVGALLLDWETPHRIFQVSPRWETLGGGFHHWRQQTIWTVPDSPWQTDIIVGNCVLYPKAAVREVGLMDIKKFPQYGDAEYTPRMKRRGWQLLIDPRARVFNKPNDRVAGFRSLALKKQFQELFTNATGPYSLKRRFNATLYGAPNKTAGLIAFAAFFVRMILGRNLEGSWGETQNESPLSEIFADRVVSPTSHENHLGNNTRTLSQQASSR